LEVLKEIKSNGKLRMIPVVVLTLAQTDTKVHVDIEGVGWRILVSRNCQKRTRMESELSRLVTALSGLVQTAT
jgi:G:T-mismatch repair DNA endonuclease (very short patch repair protein)